MTLADLPQDVIQCILNELPQNDSTALKTCASVCRAWYLPARNRRFKRVVLHTQRNYIVFHRVLSESPHLGPLVRTLYLSRINTYEDYTEAYEDFFEIVHLLTCVRELEVVGRRTVEWGTLPESCRHSITRLLKLKSLVTLRLGCFLFSWDGSGLQELFQLTTRLQTLNLEYLSLAERPVGGEAEVMRLDLVASSRLRLKNVKELGLWWRCDEILGWLSRPDCSLDLSGLRVVDFCLCSASAAFVSKVLDLTGVSLERCVGLSLNRNLADRTIFYFSANVNLRTLTLSGDLDVPDLQFQTSVFTLLESSFLTFPRNNHLQDISIRLSLWSDVPNRLYDTFTQRSSWGPLASVLSCPSFFALEKAEIIASICRPGDAGEKTAIIDLVGDS